MSGMKSGEEVSAVRFPTSDKRDCDTWHIEDCSLSSDVIGEEA